MYSRQIWIVEQISWKFSLVENVILIQHEGDFLEETLLLFGRIFGAA